MKSLIFLSLILLTFSRDYKHSTLKVGAVNNLEDLYINENLVKLEGDDLNKKEVVKELDLVLFPGDELKLIVSNGKPTKIRKNLPEGSDKHLINFKLFGKEGGFFVQKKEKKFFGFNWGFNKKNDDDDKLKVKPEHKHEHEHHENLDKAGLAITLNYSDQAGNTKTFVSGDDWECNGKKAELVEKVGENNYGWKDKLDDDAYVIWAEGNPTVVSCVFVIPKL